MGREVSKIHDLAPFWFSAAQHHMCNAHREDNGIEIRKREFKKRESTLWTWKSLKHKKKMYCIHMVLSVLFAESRQTLNANFEETERSHL